MNLSDHRLPVHFWTLLLVCLPWSDVHAQTWQSLFDGVSLRGWQHMDGSPATEGGWQATRGMLHLDRSKGEGGNLIWHRKVGDFELVFEWRISPQGNNGIKYRVDEFDGQMLGVEYQIIDDDISSLGPKQLSASIYDLFEPKTGPRSLPPGEFNRGRIVVSGDQIEHWLNGRLVAEATVGSTEWSTRISQSKFADVAGFGRNRVGWLMLTDHHDEVWFRSIYLRELGGASEQPETGTSSPLPLPTHHFRPFASQQATGPPSLGICGATSPPDRRKPTRRLRWNCRTGGRPRSATLAE